jgi:hypothetical protein
MANNQPLNTEIHVKNRLRAQRQQPNAALSIKEVCNSMTPLTMPVVGAEVLMSSTRDNPPEKGVLATSMLAGRDSGLPLVRFAQPAAKFAKNVGLVPFVAGNTGVANDMFAEGEVDFPVVIGQDKFLQTLDGAESEDIQGEQRDSPGVPTWQP